MIKCLLVAGIVRDYEFMSMKYVEQVLYSLDRWKVNYRILETFQRPDGTVLLRILWPYNNSDLIQL